MEKKCGYIIYLLGHPFCKKELGECPYGNQGENIYNPELEGRIVLCLSEGEMTTLDQKTKNEQEAIFFEEITKLDILTLINKGDA